MKSKSSHGGRRPGAGRKRIGRRVALHVADALAVAIRRCAEERGVTVSAWVRAELALAVLPDDKRRRGYALELPARTMELVRSRAAAELTSRNEWIVEAINRRLANEEVR